MKTKVTILLMAMSLVLSSQTMTMTNVAVSASINLGAACQNPSTQAVYAYRQLTNSLWTFDGFTLTPHQGAQSNNMPINFTFQSMTVHNGTLFVGGYSNTSGRSAIYRMTPTGWSSQLLPNIQRVLTPAANNNSVQKMASFNGLIYFCGDNDVYAFNGTTITPMWSATGVEAFGFLQAEGSKLYVGGNFTQVNANTSFKNLVSVNASNVMTQVAPTTMTYNNTGDHTSIKKVRLDGGRLSIFGTFRGTTVADSGYYNCSEAAINSGYYKKVYASASLYNATYYKGLFVTNHTAQLGQSNAFNDVKNTPIAYNPSANVASFHGFIISDTLYYFCNSGSHGIKKLWFGLPTSAVSTNSANCHNDGSTSTLTVNGNSPITYTWTSSTASVVSTTNTMSAITGTYYVHAMDYYGREFFDTVSYVNPVAVTIALSFTNESVNGAANGAITTTCNYAGTYSWSNGATTPNIYSLTAGWYKVTFTNANGCQKQDSAQIVALTHTYTGVQEGVMNAQIRIFPNPTSDYVQFSEVQKRVELYSEIGVLVASFEGVKEINVETLPTGIYYGICTNGRFKVIKK